MSSKEYMKVYNAEYRKKHRERLIKQNNDYYYNNLEERRNKMNEYRLKHKKDDNKRGVKYRTKNKEALKIRTQKHINEISDRYLKSSFGLKDSRLFELKRLTLKIKRYIKNN